MAVLSEPQKKAIVLAMVEDGTLVRLPGGFWVLPSVAENQTVYTPGTKYAGTQTINALVKHRYMTGYGERAVRLTPKAYAIPDDKLPDLE